MTLEPPLSGRGGSDVPLQDYSIPTARRQLLPIPGQGTLDTRAHVSLPELNIVTGCPEFALEMMSCSGFLGNYGGRD